MAENNIFIDERLENSITSLTPVVNPIDNTTPLSFTDWLKYNTKLFTTTQEFLTRYQSYLVNWYEVKGISQDTASTDIINLYTNLINTIIIDYSSADEQRFLKNIDVTNSRELTVAIPFFAKKIKDICLYYSTLRDQVQTTAVQYNLKGSNTGIDNLVYVTINRSLQSQDIVNQFSTLNLVLSDIGANMYIDIEDLYDTYSHYYDLSPILPASSYDVSVGDREKYFTFNQEDIDPLQFINSNQSIVRAILSYPFYLIELGDNFTIDPQVNSSQLNLLKDRDFISTINNGDNTNLNIINQATLTQEYMGVDFYYIATGTTTTQYTSGQLFNATSKFANILNKRYPSIAAIPSSEFLKTAKEIGLFFKPDKIGLSQFTNFNFRAEVDLANLTPNTLYYFPDPTKYGNILGNTKLEFKTPFKFFEDNYFNKIDFSNQFYFGDVYSHPFHQTLRAYQTREQSLDYSDSGLSRYIDSQDFFTGTFDTIWSHPDIYPLKSVSQYPIQERLASLLGTDKTLFQYKTDVYGNEYGLYKPTNIKQPVLRPDKTTYIDYIFNGFNFTDLNYGNANPSLNYSGLTAFAPNSFSGYSNVDTVASYTFAANQATVDAFISYDNTTYECLIRDGLYFTKPNNNLLPDYPSDSFLYDPESALLYYNELVDGAPSFVTKHHVSNHSVSAYADFTINPTTIAEYIDYDGNAFYIDSLSAEPCTLQPYTFNYTEPTNFFDIQFPYTNTEVDLSLSGKNVNRASLYYMRNIEHGDLYIRNADSTIIEPASAALSALFIKYPTNIRNELYNNIINIDVYYDTIQIETDNYLVFDTIKYDYTTNSIIGSEKAYTVLYRGIHTELEKISNVWFDESLNRLFYCKTTLFREFSASNDKAIYPEIYTIDLATRQIVQIYPPKVKESLIFNDVNQFSLYNKIIELNIVRVEKPVLSYSTETGLFTITYLGKDTANCFYIVTTRFQYTGTQVNIISCTLHTPSSNVYNITFASPIHDIYLDTNTIIGTSTGYVDSNDNTLVWGQV